jgi:hypothetical protein
MWMTRWTELLDPMSIGPQRWAESLPIPLPANRLEVWLTYE